MALQKRTKALSTLSRTLLAEGESERADFKRAAEGVNADDLVAFANTDAGGQILVGIEEKTVDNTSIGTVIGCDVSDAAILQILNKAVSCTPPVSVNVFIENVNSKPILRIDVPSSATKPHCTPKGIYCRRDGSRNRPLYPTELLKVFLDTEARAFAERFEVAAERITNDLRKLEVTLDASISNMADQLGWADMQLDDTESKLGAILGYAHRIDEETDDISSRLRSLFRQDNRDDPIRLREYKKFVASLIEAIDQRDDLVRTLASGGKLTLASQEKTPRDLTEDDVQKALDEAMAAVGKKEEELKKYAVECKAPAQCTEAVLNRFAQIVTEGDEVVGGIRRRIEDAHMLGYVTYEGAIVGTAALKKPNPSYRSKVFKDAKSKARPGDYPFEVGWIFLKNEHRKKGQMTRLLKNLMPHTEDHSVFATTRSENEIMREILLQMEFRADGEPYPSTQKPDQTLELFIRPGKQPKQG